MSHFFSRSVWGPSIKHLSLWSQLQCAANLANLKSHLFRVTCENRWLGTRTGNQLKYLLCTPSSTDRVNYKRVLNCHPLFWKFNFYFFNNNKCRAVTLNCLTKFRTYSKPSFWSAIKICDFSSLVQEESVTGEIIKDSHLFNFNTYLQEEL